MRRLCSIGMYVPPNYGPDYTQKFHGVYEQLSKELHVPLVPFLLAGIADKPEMFQADQMHPTQQAQPVLLDNVWPTFKPLLRTQFARTDKPLTTCCERTGNARSGECRSDTFANRETRLVLSASVRR